MKLWLKYLIIGSMVCTINIALAAFNLDEARRQGKVTELPNGYLTANDSSVQNDVDRINQERQREYERIAREKNVPMSAVESMAAEEIRKKKR